MSALPFPDGRGAMTALDRLEVAYSALGHELLRKRNGPWSETRAIRAAVTRAADQLLAERRRRGLPCGRGALTVALSKAQFPL